MLTSRRKKVLLEQMAVPTDYEGPRLSVTLRDPNTENQNGNFDSFLDSVFGEDKPTGPMGVFNGEQVQGNFSQSFKKHFEEKLKGVPLKDCSRFFQEVMSVKTQDEISALRIAGKFTEFVFKDLIERVEVVIDEQREEKHD